MSEYREVDPDATTDIRTTDVNGFKYLSGTTVLPHFLGGRTITLGKTPPTDSNIYSVTEIIPTPAESRYQNQVRAEVFVGAVQDPAAYVESTITYEYWPAQEIYDERIRELETLAAEVYAQGITVTLSVEGVTDMYSGGDGEAGRRWESYVSNGASALPGSTQYASRDLWNRKIVVTGSDCATGGPYPTQHSLHATTVTATQDDHQDNLDALLAADDQAGLASYDITTGWPEAPTPPEGVTRGVHSPPEARTTQTVPLSLMRYVIDDPTINGAATIPEIRRFLEANPDAHGDPSDLRRRWQNRNS